MIKDRLTEAIEANYDKIQKGDDRIPIGIRGELEVIVKDRDGNVKSYERDHNQVTKLAKMALLHLLAGEIGTTDNAVYSINNSDTGNSLRTFTIEAPGSSTPNALITSSFNPNNHDEGKNLDGQLVSGSQYFFSGSSYMSENNNLLSQVQPKDVGNQNIKFNFPTKMLFGTGLECLNNTTDLGNLYSDDAGTTISTQIINILNGYSAEQAQTDFFKYCTYQTDENVYTNWYSAIPQRARTLQPVSVDAMKVSPTSSDTAIKGAIKHCFVELSTEGTKHYNPTTKMALAQYRGYGYPCFIYATRNTDNFHAATPSEETKNLDVHYEMNDALGSVPYETEVTYTVVMPAQPVASNSIQTFYPYNGWILRQAGLFCDSRYAIRSAAVGSNYTEATMLSQANAGSDLQAPKTYRDSVGGMMLFTRNLSSPILKTADDEVTFIWHIFITV